MGSLGKQLWNLASFSHVNFEKVTHAWNSSLLRPASEWVDSTLSPLQCTDRNKPWRESQRLLKSLHNNLGNNISNNTWNQTFKQRKQAWPQLKELNGFGSGLALVHLGKHPLLENWRGGPITISPQDLVENGWQVMEVSAIKPADDLKL